MQLAVLGPMEVVSGRERLPLGGPKQRLVLGLLAAAHHRTVTVDELVDGLWPEGPQAQPRKTVQVYITRLRRTFGGDIDAIRSESAGYRLDPALSVDADEFEEDLDSITADLDDGTAAERLRGALDRWRGDAFVDLRDCAAILPMAVRLDELRLSAMHDLFEREVRRNPRTVVGELEHAVEANPLHEGFAAQLMTAQYRAGRQADALATYQALRRRLRDELGLEPGPALRDLEGRILRHELAVAAPVAVTASDRQRRRVTVLTLEMSVDGGPRGTLDPEDELMLVSPARQAARAQILQGDGVILAEAGEGLTACFGYPARERSVEMAVRAGLAIRDLGAGGTHALRTRIGIDTGVVVIEAGNERGGLELVGIAGEPIRAAMALRDEAAAGDVLVGAETAAAVTGAIELEPARLGSRAIQVRVSVGRDLPGLIGRDEPAAALATLASDADHRICTVAVTGRDGIGKSTLVGNFVAGLDDTWSVVQLRCDRRQSATPLHPFRAEFPELFTAESEPSERAVVSALRARWTARPMLVVEDVDAADPATWDVLNELVNGLPNGLVLVTSRSPEPLELGGSVVATVPMLPLDRAAARRLAADVAGVRRLELDILNEIAERSGGIPLYVGALTRAALDSGDHATVVPTSVYDSLMADLDRLGPARAAVQRCSVLGVAFAESDIELIRGAATVPREHLDAAIADGVLVDEGGGQFRFMHELTATAAYESLLKSERLALHDAIVEALPTARARAEPQRLAYHLEAAGRIFDAAVAWRRASAHAITTNRHAAAQHHARRAIALLDSLDADTLPDGGDNLRRALVNLAVALQAMSHGSAELFHVIERLRASGLADVDPARGVVVGLIDVSNRQARGDFDGAEQVARDTLDAAELLDRPSAAFARQFLGATQVWQGKLADGISELEWAASYWDVEEIPAGTSARAFGALWSQLGLAAHFQDRAKDAAELFDRARAVIPEDDGYGRCLVGATSATVDQLAGRTDVVRAAAEPLWSLAMDLSSDFWMRWAQALLGWALSSDGDASASRNGMAMIAEVVDDTAATKQAVPYFAYLLGSRLADHEMPGEGLDRVESGLAVASATGEHLWMPMLHITRARCLERAGGRDGALAAIEQAAELGDAMGSAFVVRSCRELRERVL